MGVGLISLIQNLPLLVQTERGRGTLQNSYIAFVYSLANDYIYIIHYYSAGANLFVCLQGYHLSAAVCLCCQLNRGLGPALSTPHQHSATQ